MQQETTRQPCNRIYSCFAKPEHYKSVPTKASGVARIFELKERKALCEPRSGSPTIYYSDRIEGSDCKRRQTQATTGQGEIMRHLQFRKHCAPSIHRIQRGEIMLQHAPRKKPSAIATRFALAFSQNLPLLWVLMALAMDAF